MTARNLLRGYLRSAARSDATVAEPLRLRRNGKPFRYTTAKRLFGSQPAFLSSLALLTKRSENSDEDQTFGCVRSGAASAPTERKAVPLPRGVPAHSLTNYAASCIAFALLLALAPSLAHAQFGGRRVVVDDRAHVPEWQVDPAFKHDVFSFARLRYSSWGGRSWGGGWGGGWGGRGRWATDAPDADLNLSFRLQQMTSMKVNPNVTYIDITPEALAQYPFVYMIEPGQLHFSADEVTALRNYLLNGGFMMVDDFWGEEEWYNFYTEMKRVFPEREPVDLPIEHPIFHCVFDLKEKPQMPSINHFLGTGRAYERRRDDTEGANYRAFFDDKGRMMVVICHNTDLGDGWEREGEDPTYFERFAEKMAYPMAINILFYAMTN